jgi:hypothetical protein
VSTIPRLAEAERVSSERRETPPPSDGSGRRSDVVIGTPDVVGIVASSVPAGQAAGVITT